ncbi:MAG: transketolase [Spirochaetes bacterium]|nr:transketolase [Spirochaetota bacterium]
MNETLKKQLDAFACSIRTLSMDAIQAAKSGHPGLPLGCAELGALLFSLVLKHDPENPGWENRDRFVLSAGHGSMFLYSLLHLTGYDLPLEDVKRFRQSNSLTPGHPEFGHTAGVETTTGPLGAGFSNAVGMAIAESVLAAKFNKGSNTPVDHYTWSLAGDGCMMEGVTQEAASLAGHLKLGKLIVFYDSNKITIEGNTDLAFTEDVAARFSAYGWQILKCSGYDYDAMLENIQKAKDETNRPSLIVLETKIGKGAPTKAGSHEVHGAPLGADEIKAFRKENGIDENEAFFIHPEVAPFIKERKAEWTKQRQQWNSDFEKWSSANKDLHKEWDSWYSGNFDVKFPEFKTGDSIATRSASGQVLQTVADTFPSLIGGSADLAPSNNTNMKGKGDYSADDRLGRNMHFGIREHAMGGIANGMLIHGGLRTYCATFLVFSDYMRAPVRLASLMNIPQIFVFTHDSIFVGEDGPTHQPIEHVESLRIIPGMLVLRPGDAQETAEAWKFLLNEKKRAGVILLTRQNLEVFEKSDKNWKDNIKKGAYIVQDGGSDPDTVVFATGSEVNMAIKAASMTDKKVRIISVLSRELFFSDTKYVDQLVPAKCRKVSVEAGVTTGWGRYTDEQFGIDRFGLCGPAEEVAEALGFTAKKLAAIL